MTLFQDFFAEYGYSNSRMRVPPPLFNKWHKETHAHPSCPPSLFKIKDTKHNSNVTVMILILGLNL